MEKNYERSIIGFEGNHLLSYFSFSNGAVLILSTDHCDPQFTHDLSQMKEPLKVNMPSDDKIQIEYHGRTVYPIDK
jgi:hypothetical protein